MKPTFESKDGAVKLYLANCLHVMATMGRVSATVTDPPYGLGKRMNGGTWGACQKFAEMREWDEVAPQAIVEEIVKMSESCVIWGGNYFTLPPSRGWQIWDKQNAVKTMADCEMAWTSEDKNTKRYSGPVGGHGTKHPTEKPIGLMLWSVSQLGQKETIFDPFMGSGTTGVAPVRLGRKFIGVEINPDYYEIAEERIKRELDQFRLPLNIEQPLIQADFMAIKP